MVTGSEDAPRALAGVEIVVTAERRADAIAAALERHGAGVHWASALGMIRIPRSEELMGVTEALRGNPVSIVAVTTGIGFREWMEAADELGVGEELQALLRHARIFARGAKARGAVQAAGFSPEWTAPGETTQELGARLLQEDLRGRCVIVQHHGSGSDGLDDLLTGAGAQVRSIVVYRWGPPKDPEAVVRSQRLAVARGIDAVVFTSAPGADAWFGSAGDRRADLTAAFTSRDVMAFCVGEVTARPLRARGIEPVVPARSRLGSLARSIVDHFATHRRIVRLPSGVLEVRNAHALLDGRDLGLGPSPLAALRALCTDPGVAVSRDTLLTALPDASSDHAVDTVIGRLRGAIGADSVATIVRRGYRLVCADSPRRTAPAGAVPRGPGG